MNQAMPAAEIEEQDPQKKQEAEDFLAVHLDHFRSPMEETSLREGQEDRDRATNPRIHSW